MTAERRKHERIEVDLPVMLVASGNRASAKIIDLSRGGMCLKLTDQISVDGRAEIYLEFSETDSAECEARIQWSSGRGLGLQFTEPDKRFTRFLEDLINIRPVLRTGLVKGISRAVITFSR